MISTAHRIYVSDSADMREIKDGTVDLIITSPPYPMIAMWDGMFTAADALIGSCLACGRGMEAFDRMHLILERTWDECCRVLRDGGFACINIGDAVRTLDGKFRMYPNCARTAEYFCRKGLDMLPGIHWRKPVNAPSKFMGSGMYPAGAYITLEHEYILIFRKGGKRVFDRESKRLRQESAYFWEERNIWFSDLWEMNGVRQAVPSPAGGRSRSAAFPFEIPYRLVNMYSVRGDTVLDPFCGLGTAAQACMAAGRNSIGYETDPAAAGLILKDTAAAIEISRRRTEARIKNHLRYISSLPEEKKEKCYWNSSCGFPVRTRQETGIRLEVIDSIEKKEDGSFVCRYKDPDMPEDG